MEQDYIAILKYTFDYPYLFDAAVTYPVYQKPCIKLQQAGEAQHTFTLGDVNLKSSMHGRNIFVVFIRWQQLWVEPIVKQHFDNTDFILLQRGVHSKLGVIRKPGAKVKQ